MDPALERIQIDLDSASFGAGILRDQWKVESFDFPILMMIVKGTEPNQDRRWWRFRFELSCYPAKNPECKLWHLTENQPIVNDTERPKLKNGSLNDSFKNWGNGVYRPWERMGATHLTNAPLLNWSPTKDLTFCMGDLYDRLNANQVVSVPDEGTEAPV